MSLRSNQWNRTSGTTGICRCCLHGSTGRPIQTAGHQDQAFPATVSRTVLWPFSVHFSALPMLGCAQSSLPSAKSALKEEISYLACCVSTFWPILLTAGQRDCTLCYREAVGTSAEGISAWPQRHICSQGSVWGSCPPVVQSRGPGDWVLLYYASVPLSSSKFPFSSEEDLNLFILVLIASPVFSFQVKHVYR